MKTLLYQPTHLTDVYLPNPRWSATAPNGQPQWVPQTDWYSACRAMGFLDAFFVGNQDLNRASWWMNATGKPVPGAVPPVPYCPGATDQQNSLPPNLAAVKACAGLAVNPSRFGVAGVPPRLPVIYDIEDDGTGAFAATLAGGMRQSAGQRQNCAGLMTGLIRATKQVDAQIPVGMYGAPLFPDLPVTDDTSCTAWRDVFAAQAGVACELDFACYSIYAWDVVIANPSLNFTVAARAKGYIAQFYAGLLNRRMVLVSPILEPNLNGTMASKAGQPMPMPDWQRLVDYLLGIDQPWAICVWPSGLVDPVMPHLEYLAKEAG